MSRVNHNRGQNIAVEYVLTFFVVVAVVTAMTAYVRRLVQARTRDSLFFMGNLVMEEYQGNMTVQYEPYYANAVAERVIDSTQRVEEMGSQPLPGGIIRTVMDEMTAVRTATNQASPRQAD